MDIWAKYWWVCRGIFKILLKEEGFYFWKSWQYLLQSSEFVIWNKVDHHSCINLFKYLFHKCGLQRHHDVQPVFYLLSIVYPFKTYPLSYRSFQTPLLCFMDLRNPLLDDQYKIFHWITVNRWMVRIYIDIFYEGLWGNRRRM